VVLPEQTDTSAPALTTGKEFTRTVISSLLEHPLASVPVTVYDAREVGATEIEVVVAPVFHK
jgi:hypothetical protein